MEKRERERIGKTGESETERRGEAWPDVNNKGTSVPAPGPAKLGGGRRAKEANEDKEGGGAHGKKAWLRTHGRLLYSKKQALH